MFRETEDGNAIGPLVIRVKRSSSELPVRTLGKKFVQLSEAASVYGGVCRGFRVLVGHMR